MKNLKLSEAEWDSISIEEIIVNENTEMIFLRCTSHEDASILTARAKNLPIVNDNDGPRIMMHVDQRAMKRYRAILNVEKSMREYVGGDYPNLSQDWEE